MKPTIDLTRKKLRAGTALQALALIGAGAATFGAMPAFAQSTTTATPQSTSTEEDDQATEQGPELVVTGSLFRGTETASPLTVLSADTLEERGINTVAEAMQRLSANGAGTITQGWNSGSNFATGANGVSLRGLTVQSTLTVFDGLRMAPYPLADDGHRNFVDLNTIPSSIVERIEVLRDGASSTYGADAVAGVINVITRREIQGIHIDGSAGISDEGDGAEQRISVTVGHGDLARQGYNFYINGEYQRSEALWARDRGYPFNTADLSGICGPSGSCMPNNVVNGLQADGTFLGIGTTTVPVVRPYDAAGSAATGTYQLLNPAAGCRDLTAVDLTGHLTAAQQGQIDPIQCQQDLRNQYSQLLPEQERLGFSGRFTAAVGDNAEFYAMANWYRVKTTTQLSALTFAGQTTPPGSVVYSPVFLPVYVCPTGSFSGGNVVDNGCNASNGVLNPNNPFAANGEVARLLYRYDRPRGIESESRALRGVLGLSGTLDDVWHYKFEATASNTTLDITQHNFLIPQRLMDVIADGSYNFVNPELNDETIRNYIAPTNSTRSTSDLWQVSATVDRDLFMLPGGPLQAAVGTAYRHESINNPSANPQNDAYPYERYYSVNSVGAEGSRNVFSAYFELNAPILDIFEVNLSGRYDDYSSGQSNFSPKVAAILRPVPELTLRGTWSKGFRIPSFNEAYGLPTTGYVTYQLDPSDPAQAAFIAAHGGNTYVTGGYSVGLTSSGNENLDPERSTSWTLGAVFQPISNFNVSIDYWNIEVKDLIGGADYSQVADLYYANNGVVNIPGITVLPGLADPDHPNALPLLGYIQYSFQNNDSQRVQGLDFAANLQVPLFGGTLTSSFDASYLIKFEKDIGGTVYRYDGTLSPCDVTSCSGAPKWRGSWQNTFAIDSFTVSATVYYTSGYDLASVDYGGIDGDCTANIGASVVTYRDGTPVMCRADDTWNVDLTASYRFGDHFTLYTNIMNVFDIDAPFEPSAAYSIYQFNPAWAGPNIMGRYIRIGAKVDF